MQIISNFKDNYLDRERFAQKSLSVFTCYYLILLRSNFLYHSLKPNASFPHTKEDEHQGLGCSPMAAHLQREFQQFSGLP